MLRTIITALFAICLLAVTALAQPPQAPAQTPMGPGMMGTQPQGAPPMEPAAMMGSQPMPGHNAQAIPYMVGTWQAGGFHLHHKVHGFIKDDGKQTTFVVKEQNGRVFHGSVAWSGKAPGKDTFSGVIDKDNVTFYLAGHMEGLRIGKMEGPDAFTFYYVVPGGKNPRAGYVDYKRAK